MNSTNTCSLCGAELHGAKLGGLCHRCVSKALLQLNAEAAEAPMDGVRDLAQTLARAEQGDSHAARELPPLVYEVLFRLAAQTLAREKPGHTLSPAALVHEAWLRLNQSHRQGWRARAYFFRAAAEALRRIPVDNARRTLRMRDGGPCARGGGKVD